MDIESVKKRINELLELADSVEATLKVHQAKGDGSSIRPSGIYVDLELFQQLRSTSLSFIKNVFGETHPFYQEFEANVRSPRPTDSRTGRGILKSVKQEIDSGWLFTIKDLVSAEIFTDFLDMASHLLQQKYKDPAAVIIGGVLEEHLRQSCIKNGIDATYFKDGKDFPKTADRMNNDLAAAGAYNKLYQKSVTGWLDLRNKAAHGHYSEYDIRQVELMEAGVLDFISKTK